MVLKKSYILLMEYFSLSYILHLFSLSFCVQETPAIMRFPFLIVYFHICILVMFLQFFPVFWVLYSFQILLPSSIELRVLLSQFTLYCIPQRSFLLFLVNFFHFFLT